MKYLSLFSGIEAATVAWHPIGWECVGVSEIEPFPCAVLAHHYPEVPNLGDVTKITEDDIKDLGHIDIVVFGSPCQDLSVAGLRKGFTCESTDALTRSGLFFIAMRIVEWAKKHCGCRFALWENVPGAFSSSGGRDFATVVEHMAGLENVSVPPKGWGNEGVAAGAEGLVEWATLDAQWFGVSQRRRRVFALADFGNWPNRQPILLEPESLRGDSAPSRETWEDASTKASSSIDVSCTRTLTAGFGKVGAPEIDAYTAIPWPANVAATLNSYFGEKQGLEDQHINQGAPWFVPITHSLRGEGFDASEDGTGRGTPLVPVLGQTLQAGTAVAYGIRTANTSSNGWGIQEETTHTLDQAMGIAVAFAQNSRDEVRLMGGDGSIVGALAAEPGMKQTCYVAQSVALRGREGGATAELGDEVSNCLRASGGGGDKAHVLAPVADTLYNKGIVTLKEGNASAQETYPGTLLRTLRQEVGEEAFAKWGFGILDSLQSPEVLQQALHGFSIRPAAFSRRWVVNAALSRPENHSTWLMQSLREAGCERCASQGWELEEQLARELGTYLSELSQPGPQAERFMRDLWFASEGFGLLREALSTVQEIRRSSHGQRQPVQSTEDGVGAKSNKDLCGSRMPEQVSRERVLQQACTASEEGNLGYAVRRLTPECCEFLQGFPRGYTNIPWRKQPTSPDGPRYKALGNSMCTNVMLWIGRRIEEVIK